MNEERTLVVTVRVEASAACFRRPEFVESLVSYDVMPPTVARGLLGSVARTRTGRWAIDRIGVCNQIRFGSISIDTDRGPKRCLALQHVAYLIAARWTASASAEDELNAILAEDVGRSGSLHLGIHHEHAQLTICDETAWSSDLINDGVNDLGWMVYDLGGPKHARARYFRATLVDGVLDLSGSAGNFALYS